MNKLKLLWSKLRSSFWFLPALIVAFSIALALGFIEVDSYSSRDWMEDWPRLFGANAAGAGDMLATIAGSMMTVVGVTFSMTLVTLSLASSQYTSRILRNFMSDHATQVVLGIFAGVFTYCLIVLRTVRGGDDGFVPSLSVAFSVVLAIGGIGTLIFFIHHIASSIQASSIVAAVAKETLEAVDRLFPENPEREQMQDESDPSLPPLPPRNWQTTTAVTCVDHLTTVLARLAPREIPSWRCFEDGELRAISIGQTFATLAAESFDEIRGSAGGNVAIMLRILDALQTVASLTDSPTRRQVLRVQADCLAEVARRSIESPCDRARVEDRLAQVRKALEANPSNQFPANPSKPGESQLGR